MVAIVGMCVVMYAASFVVQYMRRNDKHDGKWQQPVLIVVPDLLGNQETEARCEYQERGNVMMMTTIAVPKGIRSDHESEQDHEVFKGNIVHDIDAQYRERAQHER